MIFRIILAILAAGGGLFYVGYQEHTIASKSDSKPQVMTVEELATNGPGDNANVVISNFYLLDSFVYEGDSIEKMDKMWIPAVALDGEYVQSLAEHVGEDGKFISEPPPPKSFPVILRSSDIPNQASLTQTHNADTLAGMIVNDIEKISGDERKLLMESYPDVDINACYILDHNRVPSSSSKVYGLMGGGVLAILLSLGMGAMQLKK